MHRKWLVLGGVGAALALVLALLLWPRGDGATRGTKPPRVDKVAKVDKLLSRLAEVINNLNYETRSCEIGQWFIDRLAGQAMTKGEMQCGDVLRHLDFKSIADAVPGAMEVTRQRTQLALKKLVLEAARRPCQDSSDGAFTGTDLARVLRSAMEHCHPPNGRLLDLYPLRSRVPLPA